MILRFPDTLNGYTQGNLWEKGTVESVAKRILYSFANVDDKSELAQRKFYLARFYYDKGCYDIAMQLLKNLVFETEYVQESLIVMQKIAIRQHDALLLNNIFKLMSEYVKNGEEVFFDNMERSSIMLIDNNTDSRKVEYNEGYVEYYKDDKLLYKFFDNDYYCFVIDAQARQYLLDNKYQQGIEILDKLKKRHLKLGSILAYSMTYVRLYVKLNDYENAYEHCKPFMENNLYISPMVEILLKARDNNLDYIYEGLKAFLSKTTDINLEGMLELFELYKYGEEELWQKICDNNPFAKDDISEARYILEGINYYNKDNLEMAKKCWYKANSLYGIFGRAKYYLYFANMFGGLSQSGTKVNLDKYSIISEVVLNMLVGNLVHIKTREEFLQNLDQNLLAVDYLLTKDVQNEDLALNILFRLAELDIQPVMQMISFACTSDNATLFAKCVALAIYFNKSKKYQLIYDYKVYDNKVGVLVDVPSKKNIKYAIGMVSALHLIWDIKEKDKFYKNFYWALTSDYTNASIQLVMWLLQKYLDDDATKYMDDSIGDKDECIKCLNQIKEDMIECMANKKHIKMCDKICRIAEELMLYVENM